MEKNLNQNETQNQNTAPAEATQEPSIQQQLRDAEEAGYRRGRAEAVELALDKWKSSPDLAPDLLTRPRRSFWD